MMPPRENPSPLSAGLPPGSSSTGGYNPSDFAPREGAVWAVITDQDPGTNRYSWTQIDDGDTAAFDPGLADDFAASGTFDVGSCPAYEINGRTDVPTDGSVRCRVYTAGDMTYVVFVAPGDGGATLAEGEASLGLYTILADTTWEDTGLSVPVPGAGRYTFECTVTTRAQVSAIGATSYIVARLWDVTNGAQIDSAADIAYISHPQTTAMVVRNTTTFIIDHTTTGAATIRLEVFRGVNFTTSIIDGSSNSSITRLRYRKVG